MGMPTRLVKMPIGISKEESPRMMSSAIDHDARAQGRRKRDDAPVVRPEHHPDEVRDDEPEPADDADDCRCRCRDQRRRRDDQHLFPADVDSQRPGLFIAHREDVQPPAEEDEDHQRRWR